MLLLLVLPLLFWGETLSASNADIEIVYHIATMNNWKEIVSEQAERLHDSGLAKACGRITVTVVGPEIVEVRNIFKKLPFYKKIKFVYGGDFDAYEFPGIEMVQKIAHVNPSSKILYMHSKGVTHYQKPSEYPVQCWRRYMEYFAIDKWENCISALDTANICGVDYTRSIHGHHFFAGNFWWSTAAYAATCRLERNTRFDCEDFIGRGVEPRPKSFHQSGENPLFPYESFPEYYYYPPSSPYHQGILFLFKLCYLEEYYKTD